MISFPRGRRTHGRIPALYRLYAHVVRIWVHCVWLLLAGCAGVGGDGVEPRQLAGFAHPGWSIALHEADEVAVAIAWPRDQELPRSSEAPDFLTVYIEGDGHAWQTRRSPSQDPTPQNPLALKLALSDVGNTRMAYMARPCQFEARAYPGCEPELWTHRRYGERNLAAMSGALDQLKREGEAVILIGYSGGGVMAALLAATRNDVLGFVTIAANMDTAFWTRHHGVSPLTGSLSPLDYASRLAATPQVHWAGGEDDIVPPAIVSAYLHQLVLAEREHLAMQPDYTHHCCWVQKWPQLYTQTMERLTRQITRRERAR